MRSPTGKTIRQVLLPLFLATGFAVLYGALRLVALHSAREWDRRAAERSLNRCRDSVAAEARRLDDFVREWASRDEIWRYAADRNALFEKSDLSLEALAAADLNLLLVCDKAGEVLWARGYDPSVDTPLTFRSFSDSTLTPQLRRLLLCGSPSSSALGYWWTEHGLLLVAARPILPDAGEGEVRGTVIMGRLLSEARIARLAKRLHEHLSVVPESAGEAAPPSAEAVAVRVPSEGLLEASTVLSGLDGRPVARLAVDVPRDAYRLAKRLIVWLGLGEFLLFFFLCLLLLSPLGAHLKAPHPAPVSAGRAAAAPDADHDGHDGRLKCRLGPALAAVAGLLLSVGAAMGMRELLLRGEKMVVQEAAGDRVARFVAAVEKALVGVGSIRNALSPGVSDGQFDSEAFQRVADPFLQMSEAVSCFGWAPRLVWGEKTESPAERSGPDGAVLQLWAPGAGGSRVPVPLRPVYFPVLYAVPAGTAKRLQRLDLGAFPDLLKAMLESRDTGRPMAADARSVTPIRTRGDAIALFAPVYGGDGVPATLEDRRRAFRGCVFAVLHIEQAMRGAGARGDGRGLMFEVFGRTAAGGVKPFCAAGELRHGGWTTYSQNTGPGAVVTIPLSVAGLALECRFRAGPDFHGRAAQWPPLAVALIGVVLTVLVVQYLRAVLSRSVVVSALVAQRTRELDQANRALAESEEKYRGIFESLVDLYYRTDLDGRLVELSPSVESMTGFRAEELLGESVARVYEHPDDRKAFMKMLLRYGRVQDYELRLRRKDGAVVDVSANSRLVFGPDGRPAGVEGMLRDISRRKRMENELRRARDAAEAVNRELQQAIRRANEMALEAEAASRAKSEFLANMSHEIRTPMNGVLGMLRLLMDTDLTPAQREYAQTACHSAEALLAIINDILDYSKIEAGKLELEMLSFDLRSTVEETMDVLALHAQDKGIEFASVIGADVPTRLRGDPGRLRQVLLNLLGNAIKFTEKGEVILRVSIVEELGDSVKLRFSVTDTGIGVPASRIDALFDSFTQADASTTRKYGGTGLGLTISKRLAEMMGGEIGMESREGEGSTFWFTAVFEKQAGNDAGRTTVPVDMHVHRALVVDDNATNRRIIGEMLDSWGCRHEEAADAAAALDKLHEAAKAGERFDLVLLDMQMPGTDGLTLGTKIREEGGRLGDTHMILLTSMDVGSERDRLKRVGFDACLPKPIKQSQLYDALVSSLAGEQRPASTFERPRGPTMSRKERRLPDGRRPRILVAEDNPVNQKVALGMLTRLGCTVDTVGNGQEAVEALKMMPYDLVFMDVQMPEMDGFEATRRLRDPATGVRNPDIPVVAMTAHAMEGDRERCLAAGMNDYVSKPVDPEELERVLDRFLPVGDVETPPSAAESGEDDRPVSDAAGGADAARTVPLDREALLERIGGDADLADELVSVLLEDVPGQIQALAEAVERGDRAVAERIAHTIKGAAANLSATPLSEAGAALEAAARAGRDDLAPLFETIKAEFERLRAELAAPDGGTTA
ncbi:MAG: response regulator [Kiritimatiellaeota bacterium]|nr:response regulator [Kiritimatiellota bacterium]